MMLMTGILMSGKMSVAILDSTSGVDRRINSAITMKVYGRFRAISTIHMFVCSSALSLGVSRVCRAVLIRLAELLQL